MAIPAIIKGIQDIMRRDVGVDGDAQRIGQLGWLLFLKIFDAREEERELLEDRYQSPIPAELRWRNWARDPEGMTGDDLLEFVNGKLFPALKDLPVSGQPNDPALVVRRTFEDSYNYMKSGTLLRQVINRLEEIDFQSTKDRHVFGDIYEQILRDLQSAGNAGEYYTPRAVTQFMVEMVDPKLDDVILDPACGTGGFLTCAIDHIRGREVRTPEQELLLQSRVFGIEKKPLPHLLCTTNMLLHGFDVPVNIRHDNALARPLRDYSDDEQVDVVITNPPFQGMEEEGIESNFPAAIRTRETADLFLALVLHRLRPGGRAAIVLPDSSLFGTGVKQTLRETLLRNCDLHTVVRLPIGVFSPYTDIRTNLLFFVKGAPTRKIWFFEHVCPTGERYTKTKPIRSSHLSGAATWWHTRQENEQAWLAEADDVLADGAVLDIPNPHRENVSDAFRRALRERAAYSAELHELVEQGQKAPSTVGWSERPRVRELLSVVSELAPHVSLTSGVVEDLRTAVTELALRGELTSAEPGDESVEDTLARYTPSARTTAAKHRRATPPYAIPEHWAWVRLTDLCEFEIGRTPATNDQRYWGPAQTGGGEYAWVSISDMPRRGVVSATQRQITQLAKDEVFRRDPVPAGTLLMAFKLSVGKTAILGIEAFHNEAIASLHVSDEALRNYLLWAIPALAAHASANPAIMGSTLNSKSISGLWVPVPPEQEQRRLVAEVRRAVDQIERIAATSLRLRDASDRALKLLAQERALSEEMTLSAAAVPAAVAQASA